MEFLVNFINITCIIICILTLFWILYIKYRNKYMGKDIIYGPLVYGSIRMKQGIETIPEETKIITEDVKTIQATNIILDQSIVDKDKNI